MKFQIVAGDFPKNSTYDQGWTGSSPTLVNPAKSAWRPEKISLQGNVRNVDVVTEENQGKILRTAGWGLVGYAVLGPLGAFAGMLGTKNKNSVCFACYLKDGRKFMALADAKIYQQLAGFAFESGPSFIPASEPLPELQAARPLAIPTAFCTQCGAPRSEGAKFCGACGSALSHAPEAPRALSVSTSADGQAPSIPRGKFWIDENVAGAKKSPAGKGPCPRCKASIEFNVVGCRVCDFDFPFAVGPIREHLIAVKSLASHHFNDEKIASTLNTRGLRCLQNEGVWTAEIVRNIRDEWRF